MFALSGVLNLSQKENAQRCNLGVVIKTLLHLRTVEESVSKLLISNSFKTTNPFVLLLFFKMISLNFAC